MLLTEQEIFECIPTEEDNIAFARAIESAVLEKLKAQEPDAWRTFDGEGGYDYRSYVDNEKYQAEFLARNPSYTYKNWVEPLYLHPLPPDDVVRVAELEAVLRECREVIEEAQTYCEGPQWSPSMAHDCSTAIAKIDEVLK